MGVEFPAFLKLEYERDGAAGQALLADVDSTFNRAEQRFKEFSVEASRLIDVAMGAGRTQGGKLNLDVAGLRDFARAQENAAVAAREIATATRDAAAAAGDYSATARSAIAATEAEAKSREEAARAARSHAQAVEQVQNALQRSNTTALTGEYLKLARAEAGAAEGARQLEAISANTGLDRQAKSARDSASAFELLFRAQSAADENAAQKFLNNAFALDKQAKSARQSAQAFEALFQAEDTAAALADLARAEAAATEGAIQLQAIAANTGLDRQAKSARDSAAAFEAMFAAQEKSTQAAAAAADQLRGRLDPLFAAQQRFDQEMRTADQLLEAGAISTREYAQAQQLARDTLRQTNEALFNGETALRRGTTAQQSVINSTRASRFAFIQLGQQMQDVTVQAQLGTNAFIIFSQQVPQAAFALSGLEYSANKTAQRIGKFATFLSGPWGAAIFAATAILGPLAYKLLDTGDSAEKAKNKTFDFANGLDVLKLSAGDAEQALDQLNQKIESTIKLQGDSLRQNAALADQTVAQLEQTVNGLQTRLQALKQRDGGIFSAFTDPLGTIAVETKKVQDQLDIALAKLSKARDVQATASIAIGQRNVAERNDPNQAAINKIDAQIRDLNAQRLKSRRDNDPLSYEFITQADYEKQLARLEGLRAAEVKAQQEAKKAATASQSANREYGREIDSAQAAAIARAAGFQVNSADRSYAKQKELYDKWVAAGKPSNNPVAVPGTSAHERGNALDIQITDGVTPATIKKAFADEGVKLTKIFKEAGHYHIEFSTTGADKAARDAERLAKQAQKLQDFGQRAADQIANINGRFDEQPRLIDAAASATRQLDAIIADVSDRKPPNFEQLITDAEKAKDVIQNALVKPLNDLVQDSARTVEINKLILGGREKEAAALQEIWRLEQQLGPLTQQQKDAVEGVVIAREKELDLLDRLHDQQNLYLDATRSVKSELERLLSGQGFDLRSVFKNLQAKFTVEAVFGPALRQLDRDVKSKFDIGADNLRTETGKVTSSLSDLEASFRQAAKTLTGTPFQGVETPGATNAAYGQFLQSFDATFGTSASGRQAANDNQIVVTADRIGKSIEDTNTALALTPDAYSQMLGKALVNPLLDQLPPSLAKAIGPALQGAAGGYVSGGVPGAALGLLQGAGVKGLDGAIKGTQTGSLVAGLGNSLGIKLNETGAQIGGAIGSFIPIPGGQIIGSIAGGLLGNLFGKRPRGAAEVSNSSVYAHTNDAALTSATNDFGGSIQQSIKQIADALGVSVGNYSIGLGRYKEYYQVSSRAGDPRLGNSYFHQKSPYSLYDGTDPQAAAAAAIAEAIAQGAIKGLSATAQRILKNTPNIDQAVQNVLDFQGVFTKLKSYKDPVGAALDDLDKQFQHLKDIFQSAGATTEEYAKLEELYGIERAKAIKDAGKQITGSLQSLLDDLNIGDSGLSLRDRQANAQTKYDALKTRVQAGDTTPYDDYAQAARDLLDIERQLYGSTKQYFDTFNEVKNISQGVVDQQQALIDQASNSNSGLDMHVVKDAVDGQTNILGGKLDGLSSLLGAVNDNLITLARQSGGSGGGSPSVLYQLRTSLV